MRYAFYTNRHVHAVQKVHWALFLKASLFRGYPHVTCGTNFVPVTNLTLTLQGVVSLIVVFVLILIHVRYISNRLFPSLVIRHLQG